MPTPGALFHSFSVTRGIRKGRASDEGHPAKPQNVINLGSSGHDPPLAIELLLSYQFSTFFPAKIALT